MRLGAINNGKKKKNSCEPTNADRYYRSSLPCVPSVVELRLCHSSLVTRLPKAQHSLLFLYLQPKQCLPSAQKDIHIPQTAIVYCRQFASGPSFYVAHHSSQTIWPCGESLCCLIFFLLLLLLIFSFRPGEMSLLNWQDTKWKRWEDKKMGITH